jgi:S-adenosylmethionine decarboxylase proenzyme
MNTAGVQVLAEFLDCRNPQLLKDANLMGEVIKEAVKRAKAKCTNIYFQATPPGLTIVALLVESHITVHTYPEACHASIDVFTCSGDPEKPQKIVDYLQKALNPTVPRMKVVVRGNILEIFSENIVTSHAAVGYQVSYHADRVIFHKRSKFQDIKIIENPHFGRMLFLDNDLQIAESDAYLYNEAMVDIVIKQTWDCGEFKVAVLGGGDGGIIRELLSHDREYEKIYLVDIDQQVVAASKKHLKNIHRNAFDDPKVKIVTAEASQWLAKNTEDFDIVIYDLTTHPESFTNQDRAQFLDDIFYRITDNLSEGGKISMQCCSGYDHETRNLVESILKRYFTKIKFTSHSIPSFCEPWVFATATVK